MVRGSGILWVLDVVKKYNLGSHEKRTEKDQLGGQKMREHCNLQS